MLFGADTHDSEKEGENRYFVSEHVCMLSPKAVASHCQGYKESTELPSTQGHHPAEAATAWAGSWSSWVIHGPRAVLGGLPWQGHPQRFLPAISKCWLCVQGCLSASYASKAAHVLHLKRETVVGSPKYTRSILCCCYCSVAKSSQTLCDPMDCSTPGFPVLHYLPELAQTRVHWDGDAVQPSHPLSSPSLPAFSLSQHQGLFQWVSSLHQVAEYWSLSFSISLSNEHSGFISFSILSNTK